MAEALSLDNFHEIFILITEVLDIIFFCSSIFNTTKQIPTLFVIIILNAESHILSKIFDNYWNIGSYSHGTALYSTQHMSIWLVILTAHVFYKKAWKMPFIRILQRFCVLLKYKYKQDSCAIHCFNQDVKLKLLTTVQFFMWKTLEMPNGEEFCGVSHTGDL